MSYKELIYKIVQEIIEEYTEEKKQKKKDEVIKTTEIPTVLTPLERALANRRKTANKYDSYISSKLLPGLNK